jgi:poly(ADP-ribose) glycohydrolase ARH3
MPVDASDALRDAFRGAMLGVGVGDALGRPVKGWSAARIAREHGAVREMLGHPAGRTTEDTEMTIAVAEWILEDPALDGGELARRIRRAHDPDRGYGRTTTDVLRRLRAGEDWQAAADQVFPRGSFGNGAAARITPCALLFGGDRERLEQVVETCASVTHSHPLGVAGALLQARQVALSLSLHGMPLDAIGVAVELRSTTRSAEFRHKLRAVEECLERRATAAAVRDRLGCNATALGSVATALYCALAHGESFEEALVFAVSLGGETDAIGAMTGAIAGAYHGAAAIPARWRDALEDGRHGRRRLVELADRLLERSNG